MCVAYCQKILAEDSCREDAHRRLMCCYSRQGQRHLALRQYHTCVEALERELEVPPMPATQELYQQIQEESCSIS
jgi:DNA-binding SARP family transcriptional activator